MRRVPFQDLQQLNAQFADEFHEVLTDVLDSGRYLNGAHLERFEANFAAYCQGQFCVAVSSGLSALELMLSAYGIGRGDEVIVPANTYIATFLAILRSGATPIAVEPDSATRNLAVDQVKAAISPKTRAILGVHLYGLPCDVPALEALGQDHNIPVLIDAAQSCGAAIDGRRNATLGAASAFSFYPTKNLGALGDGGALVTDDGEVAAKVRLLRNYGMHNRYDHPLAGTNARMEELHAGILDVKLGKLPEWIAQRTRIADYYQQALSGVPQIERPTLPAGYTHSWHLYTILTPNREALQNHLTQHHIGSDIHYPVPPHRSKALANRLSPSPLPVTMYIADHTLSLPLHPLMTTDDAEVVCQAIKKFFS